MAELAKHNEDCKKWLGDECDDVNRWMDEFYPKLGPTHRKIRHHRQGVFQAQQLFGERGAAAAVIHILRDCRNVPEKDDYETGAVDPLGLRKEWPIAAYARYTEEAFSALVQYKLRGPIGILLWAFCRTATDVEGLLRGTTRLSDEVRSNLIQLWHRSVSYRSSLPAAPPSEPRPMDLSAKSELATYLSEFSEQGLFQNLKRQFTDADFAYVSVRQLINPLAIIDYEYVEQLRPLLSGDDEVSIARFAIPQEVSLEVGVLQASDGRSVTVVSGQKTLTFGGVNVREVPGTGVEVRMLVSGAPQLTMVSRVGTALILRGGIHRAYLLAAMGIQEIPAVVVAENAWPTVSAAYPAFGPAVLGSLRPPYLLDAFDEQLTITAPLMRTQKLVRVAVEEMTVPIS